MLMSHSLDKLAKLAAKFNNKDAYFRSSHQPSFYSYSIFPVNPRDTSVWHLDILLPLKFVLGLNSGVWSILHVLEPLPIHFFLLLILQEYDGYYDKCLETVFHFLLTIQR